MAIPTQLGVIFTPAEISAMEAAALVINNTIKAKIDFNLSEEERSTLSKVSAEREPYVYAAIDTYGLQFPHLGGLAVPHASAVLDNNTYNQMKQIEVLIQQATERVVELKMLAGHYTFQYMRDLYLNAQRYKDSGSVEGAQVTYDGLKNCFEGQGRQNNPLPNP